MHTTTHAHGPLSAPDAGRADGPETEDRLPDNDIMIWDSLTGDLFMDRKLQIAGSRNRVSTMALSPDGYSLMTAGWDTLVNVWVM